MTTALELGTIERVDIREVWEHEARDFTPWLADNIEVLGTALGIDIEVREQEASVGPYSLDILAHDMNSDRPIVIENQLEATDHDHLGKLLTYAAGFDANVLVWIAREFKDEHREALDLLNHRTGEDTQFYGVEIELWKIGNSFPAPNFKMVAFPNEWPPTKGPRLTSVSGRGEQYKEFYQPLIDTMREVHNFTNMKKAPTKPFCNFATGQTGFRYAPYLTTNNMNRASVQLYLNSDREKNKTYFDMLVSDKADIENELGELLWERLDDKIACRISIARNGSIDDDDETLEEIRKWMVDRLLKFKEVFKPRLEKLVDQRYSPLS